MRSICPAVRREQAPALLRISNGRLDIPGPKQEASCIPHRKLRIPAQLEKNHVVHTSSQDETLSGYSVSREVPRSVFKVETVLGTLDVTQKVPRHTGLTREEHRGSRHHSPEPLLLSLSRQEGRFPCFVWKGHPTFPSHLRMRPVSQINSRRSLVGGATF